MNLVVGWLLSTVAVLIAAYLLPGVDVANFWTAFVVAVVLGIVNAVIKPILLLLTLPINIMTLGLFGLVINALLILLVSSIVPGFIVSGFIWALLFGLIVSLVNFVLHR